MSSREIAERFMGRRVHVKIDDKVLVTGKLVGLDTSGYFEILEDDGDVHYCWPLLDIELAEPDDG